MAPTPVETPTTTASPDASDDEGGDIDEQDGVRTNSFNALPDVLGDMHLTASRSDPATHRAEREHLAADEQSRLILMAYIPHADGDGYAPVSSNADAGFRTSIDSGEGALEEGGHELIRRSATTGSYDWECFEALETQGGNFDHSFCLTTAYGRVIELQRLAVHNPDEQARNSHMDVILDDVSTALADIGS